MPHSDSIDPDATGSGEPLPQRPAGAASGPESHEREAALERGGSPVATSTGTLCAPNLPGLDSSLLYTLVSENVRDYAIFLLDPNGIITCWGESARLMKWWTRRQAEGAHLRMLYPDGGSEDGTAEAHLLQAPEAGDTPAKGIVCVVTGRRSGPM